MDRYSSLIKYTIPCSLHLLFLFCFRGSHPYIFCKHINNDHNVTIAIVILCQFWEEYKVRHPLVILTICNNPITRKVYSTILVNGICILGRKQFLHLIVCKAILFQLSIKTSNPPKGTRISNVIVMLQKFIHPVGVRNGVREALGVEGVDEFVASAFDLVTIGLFNSP